MPSPFTLGAIKNLNLTDPGVQRAFQERVQTLVFFDEAEKALWLRNILERLLLEKPELTTNPASRAVYEKLLVICQWGALHLLPDKEIIELFEAHAAEALNMPDYSIWEHLKAKLLGMMIFEERDVLKKAVREALEHNTQVLTQEKLLSRGEEIQPTVGNWIKVYVQITGTSPSDPVKRAVFFFQDLSMRRVDAATRTKLANLFRVYERLRLSSGTAQGVEEGIPIPKGVTARGEGVIRDGVFEPIDQVFLRQYEKDIAGIGDLRKVRLVGEDPREVLALLEEPKDIQEQNVLQDKKLHEKTQGVPDKVISELYQSVVPPNHSVRKDAPMAHAALRHMATSGALPDILARDTRFMGLVEQFLKTTDRSTEVQDLHQHPSRSLYVGALLRVILEEKLGMPTHEAARTALQLGFMLRNAGKRGYEQVGYYDMTDGQFYWK